MSHKVTLAADENGMPSQTAGLPCWTVSGDSVAATAQTITKAGATGRKHLITAIEIVVTGAAVANDMFIQLQDGSTTVWKSAIGSGSPRGQRVGAVFTHPIALTAGNAANLVVDAGGAGVVASINMAGFTA